VNLVRAAAAAAAAVALAGCTSGGGSTPPPPAPPPPPPPPAACLLDTGALAAATGLEWTPDESTASDTRCVYDPSGTAPETTPETTRETTPQEDPAFLTVIVEPAEEPDPAAALDTVAALCDDGSRAPAGVDGFVCRFQGGNVFAAVVRGGQLVTLAVSAVPPGTTAARLVVAFDQQLATLSG
jgi:hypothetical protein